MRHLEQKAAVGLRKTKPSYAVMIAKAHADLIRKHRDGYTSNSIYFHLAKHYASVSHRGVANALKAMAEKGYAEQSGLRSWKVTSAGRKALHPKPSKKTKRTGAALMPYLKFAAEQRPKVLAKQPNLSFVEVAQAIGQAWQKLKPEQKAAYANAQPVKAPVKPPVRKLVAKARMASAKKASRTANPREPAVAEPLDDGLFKWQYDDNGWHDYDAAASAVVEENYRQFVADPHAFDVRAVQSGSWEYCVDFKSMQQTNIAHADHKTRTVRRIAA